MMKIKKGAASARSIRGRDDRIFDALMNLLCGIVLLAVLYPLVYLVSASLSDPIRVTSGELVLFPVGFSLEGYQKIFEYTPIWTGYRNTVFYALAGTSVDLIFTLPAAYALSRRDFVGRRPLMLLFLFTMFFNGGLIPTYLTMKSLHLVNNPLILVLMGAVNVMNLIIARTYFESSIPYEIQEAAYIDGCSTTRLFFHVVLPLAKPIIAVLALFYLVSHWNSYFNALIYISNPQYYPLQIFLRNILIQDQMMDMMGDPDMIEFLMKQMQLRESMKFGIVVVSSLPVLAIYPFLQKYFVKGVMVGAIKG